MSQPSNPPIRAFRMAEQTYERSMREKYGHKWRSTMDAGERAHLDSLHRAIRSKSDSVYSRYRAIDVERTARDIAFSDALSAA